jgi:hypothetical protein
MLGRIRLEGYTILKDPYPEEVINKSEYAEEAIQERSPNYAPEILAEESGERAAALGGSFFPEVEIPLDGVAWDDIVDLIVRGVQESLRNWMPQMNSMALRTCRTVLWPLR